MVRVFVKWGKERFEVEANTNDSPLQLKSQLFSLTGVNPDRQKVLIKIYKVKFLVITAGMVVS
uniref:Ubiquitin-like domain-containing protein n=1 Tax=Brugia malayi TaxID=6279 RepID=A8PK18_BRUMA